MCAAGLRSTQGLRTQGSAPQANLEAGKRQDLEGKTPLSKKGSRHRRWHYYPTCAWRRVQDSHHNPAGTVHEAELAEPGSAFSSARAPIRLLPSPILLLAREEPDGHPGGARMAHSR